MLILLLLRFLFLLLFSWFVNPHLQTFAAAARVEALVGALAFSVVAIVAALAALVAILAAGCPVLFIADL